MPIVYTPSLKAMGIIPFNINPHYIDPQPESKHMGETRAPRIKEFHHYNSQSVVGLREGSFLEITGDEITLKGTLKARVFKQGVLAYEIDSGTDLSNFK
jgi:dipeptidase E